MSILCGLFGHRKVGTHFTTQTFLNEHGKPRCIGWEYKVCGRCRHLYDKKPDPLGSSSVMVSSELQQWLDEGPQP